MCEHGAVLFPKLLALVAERKIIRLRDERSGETLRCDILAMESARARRDDDDEESAQRDRWREGRVPSRGLIAIGEELEKRNDPTARRAEKRFPELVSFLLINRRVRSTGKIDDSVDLSTSVSFSGRTSRELPFHVLRESFELSLER